MRSADDKRDFGLVIVLLRAILRWSRPARSQASGVDEDLIADCERGISRPIRKNRERLARAFGVEPSSPPASRANDPSRSRATSASSALMRACNFFSRS